jgi:exonuclease SbcD
MIIVAGDIFDTHNPSSAAEELFYEAIERLNNKGKRAIVIIAGNHDSPDRLCASSPLAYKNGIILLGFPSSKAGDYTCENNNIKIVASGRGWFELKLSKYDYNAVILTLPYPSESRLEEVITYETSEEKLQKAYSDRIRELLLQLSQNFREDTINLVASHIYLRDGKISDSERQLGGALIVEPEAIPPNAHYAALGHLHRPQRIKSAPIPTYYSGSPLAYSFSETNYSKAVFIIDAEPTKQVEVNEIYLKSGKPLKQWIVKNGIEEAIRWCEEGKDINCWIDLEIHTDRIITPEEQKNLRELNPGIINIRPSLKTKDNQENEYINRETRRIDQLFKDFFTHKMGIEMSEDIMHVFLDIVNDQEERDSETDLRGEDYETKIS